MDHARFDSWTRELTSRPRSRRWAVGHIAGAALGGLVAAAGFDRPAAAAACKKADQPCRRDGQCCSGVCGGKRGKKQCRGHGAGTCKRGQDVCTAPNQVALRCNNSDICSCVLTTSATSFCANFAGFTVEANCARCDRDADCGKLGFPAGSACIVTTRGACAGTCETGRACVTRCGVAPPPPE